MGFLNSLQNRRQLLLGTNFTENKLALMARVTEFKVKNRYVSIF